MNGMQRVSLLKNSDWYASTYFIYFLRLVIGIIFILAAFDKIGKPVELGRIIFSYKIIPSQLSFVINFMAVTMPWFELLAGIGLITGILTRASAFIIAAMNIIFIPAIAFRAFDIMHEQGISFFSVNFDCGCGLGHFDAWILLLRDIVFILIAIYILYFGKESEKFPLSKIK